VGFARRVLPRYNLQYPSGEAGLRSSVECVRIIALVAAAFGLSAASTARAQDVSELQQFLLTYRCAAIERLKIVAGTVRPKDRYFIFSLKSDPHAYVQCLFLPDEPRVLCEAASGFYLSKPGEPRSPWRMQKDSLAELERLGFSIDDSNGNFQRIIDLPPRIDFAAIADLILSAIYHGYGARVGTPMDWNAPLVPRDDDSDAQCTPLG
jgi:hypothetical protein